MLPCATTVELYHVVNGVRLRRMHVCLVRCEAFFLFYKLGVTLATAGCRGGVSPCNSLIEQVE